MKDKTPKVRLVGGPFGGRVIKCPQAGRNEFIYRDKKKMTRAERADYYFHNPPGLYQGPGSMRWPMVEARYHIAMRPHINGHNVTYMPCMHPDGSLFYEYVKDSKREYR